MARFGLSFADLYDHQGLIRLDQAFLQELAQTDAPLRTRLLAARADVTTLAVKIESELLLALAPHLNDFIGLFFGIESEVGALAERHHALAPLYSVKRLFVQRKAMHKYKAEAAAAIDGVAIGERLTLLFGEPLTELVFARHVLQLQQN